MKLQELQKTKNLQNTKHHHLPPKIQLTCLKIVPQYARTLDMDLFHMACQVKKRWMVRNLSSATQRYVHGSANMVLTHKMAVQIQNVSFSTPYTVEILCDTACAIRNNAHTHTWLGQKELIKPSQINLIDQLILDHKESQTNLANTGTTQQQHLETTKTTSKILIDTTPIIHCINTILHSKIKHRKTTNTNTTKININTTKMTSLHLQTNPLNKPISNKVETYLKTENIHYNKIFQTY